MFRLMDRLVNHVWAVNKILDVALLPLSDLLECSQKVNRLMMFIIMIIVICVILCLKMHLTAMVIMMTK